VPVRYTRELLEEAARETTNANDAVRWCGGTPTPGSRSYLRKKMAEWGVDISHFTTGRVHHSEARLREVVSQSTTIKEVLRRLDISPVGGNHTHISRRIRALNIDTAHFSPPPRRPKGQPGNLLVLKTPLAGRTPGERLRRELIRSGVEERCAICGTGTVWNNLPLRLEVDHRNGDWWDNRPDNLRLLCPNCHAITDTHRGRKRPSAS